jgi:cytochrome P450
MGMAQYAVFRSPYNFKDPEIYLPERWLDDEGPYKNDRREALQPFSFGPRNCIGRKCVYISIITFVSALSSRYTDWILFLQFSQHRNETHSR